MNTRRYPRTLGEAFPHSADYASSITRYSNPCRGDAAVLWTCLLGLVVVVVVLLLAPAPVLPYALEAEGQALCAKARGPNSEARDRKSTRLNSSHIQKSRMPSSA